MSKKANPTVVGSFVLGAVGLAVAAAVLLGSGSFFHPRPRAVAFFQGNIQGLSIGAPVTLRGVRVGTVTDIKIEVNAQDLIPRVPVFMEFEPERLSFVGFVKGATDDQGLLKAGIDKGMHARLASQSFVTGQLLVDLTFDRDGTTRLVGADPSLVEIPTSLSEIEKLKETLANIPVDEIARSLQNTLQDVDKLVTSPQIPRLLDALVVAGDNLDTITDNVKLALPGMVANIENTSKSAQQTLATAGSALAEMRATFTNASHLMNSDMHETLVAAKNAAQRADKLLVDTDTIFTQNSPQRYDIDQILQNLAATTRSLRAFSAELDRRPNAVILGK